VEQIDPRPPKSGQFTDSQGTPVGKTWDLLPYQAGELVVMVDRGTNMTSMKYSRHGWAMAQRLVNAGVGQPGGTQPKSPGKWLPNGCRSVVDR